MGSCILAPLFCFFNEENTSQSATITEFILKVKFMEELEIYGIVMWLSDCRRSLDW
jgi:hypothetical protein